MALKLIRIYFLLIFSPFAATSQDAVKAENFITEPPTLSNLGFEWHISGDENRNAVVQVTYRISGTDKWEQALPLMRAGGEKVFRKTEFLDYSVPHFFAGSILDLAPGDRKSTRLNSSHS